MTIALEIVPLAQSLDLYGEPDPSSAYSLSGHVAVSLTASTSWFDRTRPTRVLLESLTITFEGQSEIVALDPGYSAARLCAVTRELVDEPIELGSDSIEEAQKSCAYNIIFDLPVPGWLPATSSHGDAFTSYALHATATYAVLDDRPSTLSGWRSALSCLGTRYMVLHSRSRTVDADECCVTVNRFVNPPEPGIRPNGQLFPDAVYSVAARADPMQPRPTDDAQVPLEILAGIKVVAVVPEHIPITATSSFPLSLRFRTDSTVADADRRKLRLGSFGAELRQTDRYRGQISQAYRSTFSIPSEAHQPPNMSLLSPHPTSAMYELGLIVGPRYDDTVTCRSFSILDPSHPGKFQLAGDGYVFPDNSDMESPDEGEPQWYHVDTSIPFAQDVRCLAGKSHVDGLRETARGPLVSTEHSLHIMLECTYDLEDPADAESSATPKPRRATELLHFSLPLSFVRSPAVTPRPALSLVIPGFASALVPSIGFPSPSSPSTSAFGSSAPPTPGLSVSSQLPSPTSPFGFPASPYGPISALPAYNQLFDSNGERKLDYSLPLYTPSPISPAYDEEDVPAGESAPLVPSGHRR